RAYELATPADKAGGDVIPWSLRVQAAADGSAVEYSSLSSFADPKGTSLSSEYIAERTGAPGTSGWSTHNITPATEPLPPYGFFSVIPAYMGEFSADLNHGVYRSYLPLEENSDVGGLPNLYPRDDLPSQGATQQHIITDPGYPLAATSAPLGPFYVGGSSDYSKL